MLTPVPRHVEIIQCALDETLKPLQIYSGVLNSVMDAADDELPTSSLLPGLGSSASRLDPNWPRHRIRTV